MQTEKAKGVCPVCKGRREVKGKDGKLVTCQRCRGTGKAGDYTAK